MRTLILGTAGHIDHGKTALVRALTGIDTDRLPEEKQRGITIDIGFARLALDDETEIGIVDVPGHEAFVRNMLAGATGVDIALLVIAADEGVMPQTREHLAILQLLGVRSLLVVLSKADLVDAEWLELVRDDVAQLIATTGFADARILAVSAVTGSGLDSLRTELRAAAREVEVRDAGDLFRMPIDRIFTVKGTGTVVTGTVWSGCIALDQSAVVLPHGSRVRVRGIQTHGRERDTARAGERAALALVGTARDAIVRGDTLIASDAWRPTHIVTGRVHLLADAPPLRTRQRVRFHLGTAEVLGRVALLEPGPLEPGADGWSQIRLEQPIVCRAGDRFVLRSYSPVVTIAGGSVAEPAAPKRKRASPDLRLRLHHILEGEPGDALDAALAIAGFTGVGRDEIPLLVPRVASRVSGEQRFTAGDRVFDPSVADEAGRIFVDALGRFHKHHTLAGGMDREALRQLLPSHAHAGLADAVIDRLTDSGAASADGHTLRLAGFTPSLDKDQEAAAARIEELYRGAGLAPPATDEIPQPLAGRADLQDLIHYLQRAGRLVGLPGSRWVHPEALGSAVRLLHERFEGRTDLSPADFRDLFGVSRKYLIPLLEHLDRTGVTTRTGEVRRLEPSVPG